MAKISSRVLLLFILIALTGCAIRKAAVHPEPMGFVTRRDADDPGIVSDQMPFMYFWINSAYRSSERGRSFREQGYYLLYVKPVGTQYLRLEDKRRSFVKAVHKAADYLSDKIVEDIGNQRSGSLRVFLEEDRNKADFALEIELTEIGFGTPIFYVTAWAVPLPGVSTIFNANFSAVLAFEGRIIDLSSDRVEAEFYDRKLPKMRLFDMNKALSRSGPLRDISNDWSQEITKSLSARLDKGTIKGRSVFTLMPW